MSPAERWKYALKPASWPKLLVPFICAQAIAFADGQFLWFALLFGVVFVLLDGSFIVLMNDWCDARVDVIKRKMFPDGCSPKTIPDGILSSTQVLVAGVTSGALAISVGFIVKTFFDRPFAGVLAAGCVALFAAYSLPPLKMNYRGGGEILETIGVGWALPWFCVYLHTNSLWSDPWLAFAAGALPFALASALASGLSDEQSDIAGGKRTFVTMYGNEKVRKLIYVLPIVGAVIWYGSLVLFFDFRHAWLAAPVLGLVVRRNLLLRQLGNEAKTNAFPEIGLFKKELHRTGWIANVAAAAMMVIAWCM